MPKADRTSPWVGQAGGGDRSRPGVGVGGADLETGLAELDSAGLEGSWGQRMTSSVSRWRCMLYVMPGTWELAG